MVSDKQRRRQLARAKWDRQSVRRSQDAKRHRRISILVSVIVGLAVAAGLIWVVLYILDQEKQDQTPVVPTDSFVTDLRTPATNGGESSGQPTTQPTTPPTSQPITPPTSQPTSPPTSPSLQPTEATSSPPESS